jgi:hypothetical protein
VTALLQLSGLVIADSLNAFNIGAVWAIAHGARMKRRSPLPGGLAFIAGMYAFTACYGLGMVMGLDALTRSVHVDITPEFRYRAELVVGIALIGIACLPWRRRQRRTKPRMGALLRSRPWLLGVVGVGVGATQAPFSLPYLTLLTAIATRDPLPTVWPVVVLVYAAAVQVPPLLALALANWRSPKARRVQLAVAMAVTTYGRTALRILLAVVGSVLLYDAVANSAQW